MACRTRRAAVMTAKVVVWSALVGLPTWFWFDRDPPVRIDDIKIQDTDVARGGLLKLRYTGFRFRNCGGDIQRIVVDSQEVVHLVQPYTFTPPAAGEGVTALTRLGHFELPVSAPVPEGAATGPARYQAVVHYRCNPLQLAGVFPPIDVTTPVQSFDIVDKVVLRPSAPQRVPNAITPEPGASDRYIPNIPALRRRSDLGPVVEQPTFVYDAPFEIPTRPLVIGRN